MTRKGKLQGRGSKQKKGAGFSAEHGRGGSLRP